MDDLLFLAHRIPFPPNKGDKLRSYHLLKHLAARYRVHLGTFVDDPADWEHVPAVAALCGGETLCLPLAPVRAKLRSLTGLVIGQALTVPYYRDGKMAEWVDDIVARHAIRRVVVFSSPMAQYVNDLDGVSRLVDFVDVDSHKWTQYAEASGAAAAWLYRREARKLLEYEIHCASRAVASVFVTRPEAELFRGLIVDAADANLQVLTIENGVDASYFSPARAFAKPDGWQNDRGDQSGTTIVFTGAMDYRPNIDAAAWFARDVLPIVRRSVLAAQFCIVGARPSAEVRALAKHGEVTVTGTVDDVRPYLMHAALVVVPMRLARGIQNKALEAMAMGAATVVSAMSAAALNAIPGRDFCVADDAQSFARVVVELLGDAKRRGALGAAARFAVLENYDWTHNLARIDRCFDSDFDRGVDRLFECARRVESPDASVTRSVSRDVLRATGVEHA